MREGSGNWNYYCTDLLGSVRSVTNSAQAVVKTMDYDIWGKVMDETGTSANKYTFTGRRQDNDTGFI